MSRSKMLLVIAAVLLVAPVVHASDPASLCTAAKLKATAKKTSAKLRCHATAAARVRPVDPDCLAVAERKFSAAWARIEARGGCLTTNDEDTVESKVDAYVTDVVTTFQLCGMHGGICGGACPGPDPNQRCFVLVGCNGVPEPCRCHGSTSTCPPSTSSSTSTTLP